jgi:hypothetical protein
VRLVAEQELLHVSSVTSDDGMCHEIPDAEQSHLIFKEVDRPTLTLWLAIEDSNCFHRNSARYTLQISNFSYTVQYHSYTSTSSKLKLQGSF